MIYALAVVVIFVVFWVVAIRHANKSGTYMHDSLSNGLSASERKAWANGRSNGQYDGPDATDLTQI